MKALDEYVHGLASQVLVLSDEQHINNQEHDDIVHARSCTCGIIGKYSTLVQFS